MNCPNSSFLVQNIDRGLVQLSREEIFHFQDDSPIAIGGARGAEPFELTAEHGYLAYAYRFKSGGFRSNHGPAVGIDEPQHDLVFMDGSLFFGGLSLRRRVLRFGTLWQGAGLGEDKAERDTSGECHDSERPSQAWIRITARMLHKSLVDHG